MPGCYLTLLTQGNLFKTLSETFLQGRSHGHENDVPRLPTCRRPRLCPSIDMRSDRDRQPATENHRARKAAARAIVDCVECPWGQPPGSKTDAGRRRAKLHRLR